MFLEKIFEIYKNQAIRYAYLITNNKFTSEDIVQETFVKCKYKLKEQIAETDKNFKLNTDDYAIMDYFERSNQPSEVQKILDATKIIHKSKQIIFLGIGTSGILAKYASRCFVNIGRFAVYIDYPYFLVPDGFYDEIVIIVFSVTGEIEDIINQLRQFRNFDCVIISITNSEMS
ncbi:SIS domain-containing protein, partial [Clostridium neonatale]